MWTYDAVALSVPSLDSAAHHHVGPTAHDTAGPIGNENNLFGVDDYNDRPIPGMISLPRRVPGTAAGTDDDDDVQGAPILAIAPPKFVPPYISSPSSFARYTAASASAPAFSAQGKGVLHLSLSLSSLRCPVGTLEPAASLACPRRPSTASCKRDVQGHLASPLTARTTLLDAETHLHLPRRDRPPPYADTPFKLPRRCSHVLDTAHDCPVRSTQCACAAHLAPPSSPSPSRRPSPFTLSYQRAVENRARRAPVTIQHSTRPSRVRAPASGIFDTTTPTSGVPTHTALAHPFITTYQAYAAHPPLPFTTTSVERRIQYQQDIPKSREGAKHVPHHLLPCSAVRRRPRHSV
ncbi:hypothetical protein DFH07DRAFT_1058395 [Mycena maculata]|uniref:Uncharacterized protein n=1 Tax=Mycena maculata TaxID=230809 RepID=A0AAD7JMQ8_9AGAR|nr:hypothetical protein DFH07DRAFT_1058395 [Mycena maculata]